MEQALQHNESGLNAFEESSEDHELKYILIRNKALFLERMDRFTEGLQVIQDNWHLIPKVRQNRKHARLLLGSSRNAPPLRTIG